MTTKIPVELSSTPGIADSSNATAITITSDEEVGIGTTTPNDYDNNSAGISSNLVVKDSGHSGIIVISGTSSDAAISFGDGTGTAAYRGAVAYVNSADALYFKAAGANKLRLDSDGLKFGSDTAAANALDDYEEGTWTVSDGSGAGLSFTVDKNRYTKIGRFVMAHTRVTYPSTSDSSTATVALPFTPSSNCIGSVTGGICTEQDFNTGVAVTASIDSTAGTRFRSNGGGALTNAQLSGKTVRFTVTFII